MVEVKKTLLLIASVLILNLVAVSGAWAREPATPEFTMKQAVDKAQQFSKTIRNAEYDVDRSYELRQFSFDDVKYVPQGTTSPEAEQDYTNFALSDINWQSAKKTLESTQDNIEVAVYQAYFSIIQGKLKVSVAEEDLKNSVEKERIAMVGYRVGTVNQAGLIEAQAARATSESSLVAARKALDDAYQKFNLLVGLWPDDRPVLTDNPNLSPLVIDNLDTEVQRAIERSPSIWLANQKIDYANLKMDLYFAGDRSAISEPYEVKDIDVKKAETSLEESKEKVRKLVRTLYYTALQKEELYSSTLESIKVAEESLRVKKIKLDVGMATKSEVLAAELAVDQARQTLLSTVCDHELLVMYFRKPWTYA